MGARSGIDSPVASSAAHAPTIACDFRYMYAGSRCRGLTERARLDRNTATWASSSASRENLPGSVPRPTAIGPPFDDDAALAARPFDFKLDADFRKPRMKQSDDAIYYGAVNYGKQRPPLRG